MTKKGWAAMRVLLQRVTRGSVTVAGDVVGAVDAGFVALVGAGAGDSSAEARMLARKTAHLRVFEDEGGRMNHSLLETGGGVLVISQFTLYADVRRGRRPSFTGAAHPSIAAPLVEEYAAALRAEGVARVETGVFGAMMQVEILNDGPVTIWLDSAEMGG
jgi:D-tyrosyl-tRNA(Tyr) deacylase